MTLYASDLTALLEKWESKKKTYGYEGMEECINDLKTLMDRTADEEAQRFACPEDLMTPEEMTEYFNDLDADYWVEESKNNIYYS